MTTAIIDPRIRARRIAVARNAGRQRLRRMSYLVALLLSIAVAWALTRTALLDVDRVDVRGAEHSGVQAVRLVSGVDLGSQMFDLDSEEIATAVSVLPWVARVEVSRDWPGTVNIQVTERSAVALVLHPSGTTAAPVWALLDGNGRVLALTGESLTQFPRLVSNSVVGGAGTEMSVEIRPALRVAERLPATIASELDVVRITSSGDVILDFSAGGSAIIGPISQLEAKFLAILTILESGPGMSARDIDVRAPQTPVMLAQPEMPEA